ncbi:LacI family DNA-binding transcriptional regulator [Bifidobacterium bombi]|uniref:Ribose operon repressor RbsR n=1 Tax=Bifidobacterium bombi DSM 19703 TaxID=1341695 RepID=A0A086BNI5_9BIFI|nr:LacI family DNA-binding transcriptional regulator [Bifidobacterium bombi]KFF30499.1 ribose operon repressor RbsR [Bifidobacterium bombi DSM 19703]
MKHRTTLKDIAHEAKVSVTSVSLVLNGRPTRITEGKRQLILDTARRLNYVANQTARSLVTNRSMLLALLVPDIENMFFASLAKALEDVSRAEGYSLIIANSDDSQDNELTLLHQFEARAIDGLYLIPSAQSVEQSDNLRKAVESLGFPTVLTDRKVGGKWCDSVRSDNFAGGRIAAQTLISSGHTRIACICQTLAVPTGQRDIGHDPLNDKELRRRNHGSRHMQSFDARREGFLTGLNEAGLSLDPTLDCFGNYRFSGGYNVADHIIDAGATAVFCANDLMAMGFMQRMSERGLNCPEDCSVIGYDNVVSRYGLGAQLTTLDQNINALTSACHSMMMGRLSQDTSQQAWLTDPQERLIKPELVKLGTVGHPAASR